MMSKGKLGYYLLVLCCATLLIYLVANALQEPEETVVEIYSNEVQFLAWQSNISYAHIDNINLLDYMGTWIALKSRYNVFAEPQNATDFVRLVGDGGEIFWYSYAPSTSGSSIGFLDRGANRFSLPKSEREQTKRNGMFFNYYGINASAPMYPIRYQEAYLAPRFDFQIMGKNDSAITFHYGRADAIGGAIVLWVAITIGSLVALFCVILIGFMIWDGCGWLREKIRGGT